LPNRPPPAYSTASRTAPAGAVDRRKGPRVYQWRGPLAQLAEQLTLNQPVQSSSLWRLTRPGGEDRKGAGTQLGARPFICAGFVRLEWPDPFGATPIALGRVV